MLSHKIDLRWTRPRWRPTTLLVAAVLILNLSLVAIGGVYYLHDGSRRLFDEIGVVDLIESAELAIAASAGVAAYGHARWRHAGRIEKRERDGIRYWGVSGIALALFAIDDFIALHERTRAWMDHNAALGSSVTNTGDDLLTLTVAVAGVAALFVWRAEVLASRRSARLLLFGAACAVLMIAFDSFGKGWMRALEFPCQAAAIGLVLSAYVTRLAEVTGARAPSPGNPPSIARAPHAP